MLLEGSLKYERIRTQIMGNSSSTETEDTTQNIAFYNTLPPTTLSTTHSVSNKICNRPISPLQQGLLCIHQKMITNQQHTALRKPSSLYFIQGTWNILSLSDPICIILLHPPIEIIDASQGPSFLGIRIRYILGDETI